MKYVRRKAEVEAIEFTPEIGELAMAKSGYMGITYEEGRGYRYRGHTVRFGDFLVTSHGVKAVWSKGDFHAQFVESDRPEDPFTAITAKTISEQEVWIRHLEKNLETYRATDVKIAALVIEPDESGARQWNSEELVAAVQKLKESAKLSADACKPPAWFEGIQSH